MARTPERADLNGQRSCPFPSATLPKPGHDRKGEPVTVLSKVASDGASAQDKELTSGARRNNLSFDRGCREAAARTPAAATNYRGPACLMRFTHNVPAASIP